MKQTLRTCIVLSPLLLNGCTWTPIIEPFFREYEYDQHATDCSPIATEYDRLLKLSYEEFDQDLDGGWRALEARGRCAPIAAKLILDYLGANQDSELSPMQVRLLLWHAAQTTAYYNEVAAIDLFEKTYETTTRSTQWDIYVDGTIAFLRKDRRALDDALNMLSKQNVTVEEQTERQVFLDANPNLTMPKGFVTDPPNLPVLRALKRCFHLPYRVAYNTCP